ncbi:MAG: hypothetical protein JW841_04135 [Deltaproteobacteria bacterium]|nr:hypothetical protein [Deltaproteobacteria bacterium]
MSDQTRRVSRVKSSSRKTKRTSDRSNKNTSKSPACRAQTTRRTQTVSAQTSSRIKIKTNARTQSCACSRYQQAVAYLLKQYRKCLQMLGELARLVESYYEDAQAHVYLVEKRFKEHEHLHEDQHDKS